MNIDDNELSKTKQGTANLKNIANPYSKLKHKSRSQWHTFWVFEDPEFKSDISELKKKLKIKGGVKEVKHQLININEKYHVELGAILSFMIEEHTPVNYSPIFSIKLNDGSKPLTPRSINVEFGINTTYDDYKDSYKEFDVFRNKVIKQKKSRKRPPDDTQLIYAIFKAKRDKLRFKEIYNLYEKGNLPMYKDKPKNQFINSDSLKAYYQKYKPERITLEEPLYIS